MLDPLLSLIAAKVKAVGLVAGTAMVTTALVGGGAVAMTTVSNDDDVAPETSVTQDALLTTETESDTGTVGIEPEAPKEATVDRPRVPTVEFVCDESLNHGQNVSAFAKSLEKGPGRGEQISAVAQSDCGKKADDETEVGSESAEDAEDAEEAEVERTDEEKAAKKAEQAQKKAERKGASAEKKAGKGKK